LDEY